MHEVWARAENVRVTRKGEWVGCERIQRANIESERKQGQNSAYLQTREKGLFR